MSVTKENKSFAEIGIGNDNFLSTKFEEGNCEYRVPKFIKPKKIDDYYLRIWIFKLVFILSTKDGVKFKVKDRNKLKFLFGVGGRN